MHIFYSEQHRGHNTAGLVVDGQPFGSEEIPERAELILGALHEAGIGTVTPPADFGREPLRRVHTDEYLDYLENGYARSRPYYHNIRPKQPSHPLLPETFANRYARFRPQDIIGQAGYHAFGVGTPILEGTWQAAYWSAQCALTAAQALLPAADQPKGKGYAAYALCRPPGHHAAADLYGGYCYLNNAAMAARFLGGRVAILDIDYHHGNGTQEIFYHDGQVLYCSLHAEPETNYPYYWGTAAETGAGAGIGANLNIPLPNGTGARQYLRALDTALDKIRAFQAEKLVVSVGFDTLLGDPAGGFTLAAADFLEVGERIAALTQAGLPTLLVQEGGYLLDQLGRCAVNFLSQFS